MCWSFQASIITWIIGLATGIFLLARRHKNDTVMGLLILTYSAMQLWEAIMWLDQDCQDGNAIATQGAYYTLWAHVLAIGVGLLIEYNVKAPIVIGFLFMVASVIFRPRVWQCSLKAENGHLKWGFDPTFYMVVFATAIAMCAYYIRPIEVSVVICGLFLVSYIISYLLNQKYQTTGSFWCWVCAAFCFLFILANGVKDFTF